jgi:hypothetical protein
MVNNDNFLLKEIPSENIYYVYGYYLEDDTPFYIGMGKKDRINRHKKLCFINGRHYDYPFYRKLRKLYDNNTSFYCSKIRDNMSRKDAQNLEISLISELGRKFNGGGVLYNLTSGGEGGNGGISHMKKIAIYDTKSLLLVKTFRSINECSKYTGVLASNVSTANKTKGIIGRATKNELFYVKRYDDIPDLRFIPKTYKRDYDSKRTKITAISVIDCSIINFNGSKACCKYFDCHKQTVRARALDGKEIKGYILKYD